MSASSWAQRLEAKLSSLTETSSKESIQTLAKWLGFNRKHASAFAQVLQTRLQQQDDNNNNNANMTEKLQVTYVNVIHEVMILEQHNTAKWDRLSELRCALGEEVVLHLAKQNAWSPMAKDKLLSTAAGGGGFLKIWDTSNVFGGPTLISQIRKELASPSSSSSPTKASTSSSSSSSPNKTDEKAPPAPPSTAAAEAKSLPPPTEAAAAEEEETPLPKQQEKATTTTTEESSIKETEQPKAAAADASETLPGSEEDTTNNESVPSEPLVKNEKENKTNSTLKMPPSQDAPESAMKKIRTLPPEKAAAALQEEESTDSLLSSSKPAAAAAATTVQAASSSPPAPADHETTTTALFDFQGATAGFSEEKVNPKEFLEPCRAIATLQIARDLRSDGAVQLSSLLSGLPTEVRKACAAYAAAYAELNESEAAEFEIPEEQARDFSIQVQEDGIVDLDLDEEMRNIRTFREIVQRQGEARQKLYMLLTKSKCKFGSDEAVAAMYQADMARCDILRKRKRILADAMELEGLDVPEEKSKTTMEQEKLVPLPWYTPPPPPPDNDATVDGGVAES